MTRPSDLEPQASEPTPAPADPGPPLPELPPQPRVRAMVRDPGTTFVYWDDGARAEGWTVEAQGRDGQTLGTARAADHSAYVQAPAGEIDRVTLRRADGQRSPARTAELPWAGGAEPAPRPEQAEGPRALSSISRYSS